MLSLPHPHTQLPLSDKPANVYRNHLVVVEPCDDSNSAMLQLLSDVDDDNMACGNEGASIIIDDVPTYYNILAPPPENKTLQWQGFFPPLGIFIVTQMKLVAKLSCK